MKTKLSLTALLSFVFYLLSSQVPQGFNYQAIARDGSGNPISTPINVKIAILSSTDDADVIWEELHAGVDPDDHGLFSIVVGDGVTQAGGLASFSLIDWTETPLFIRTKINDVKLGTTQLYSVPYAMVADSLGGTLSKLKVKGSAGSTLDEALFEVKNKTGQTVFAVYNEGVRIYVDDGDVKGAKGGFSVGGFGTDKAGESQPLLVVNPDSIRAYVYDDPLSKTPKGGFAVGGFDGAKGLTNEYLRVSPDSVRVYIDNRPTTKGPKGGFSVGGFDAGGKTGEIQPLLVVSQDSIRAYVYDDPLAKSPKGGFAVGGFDAAKGLTNDYLMVSPDSVRVYIDNRSSTKGPKGGFSVGGFDVAGKGETQKFLTVSNDSVRIYIDDGSGGKGAKGGFSVGGFDQAKGGNSSFFNIATTSNDTIDPSEPRVLWYPMHDKNAFLVGMVLIQHPDSVGDNSVSLGYESMAKGAQSQAFGYQSKARGDYSTAIGYQAIAHKNNSFALGQIAKAMALNSYSFGYNTQAKGQYSFAFGQGSIALSSGSYAFGKTASANGQNSFAFGENVTAVTTSSYAFGKSAVANGQSSFALGESVTAGLNTTITNAYAFGKSSQAKANSSFAFGDGAIANSTGSYAFGKTATANGQNSFAFGESVTAETTSSYAFGKSAIANGQSSFALGESVTAGLNTTITNAYAFGKNSQAKANSSFAFGDGAIANSTGSYAFGKTAISNGPYSFAFGESVTAGLTTSVTNAYAFGLNSNAKANYSFAMGEAVNANNLNSYAFGKNSTASNDNAIAMGLNATASGLGSFSINGLAQGQNSFAVNGNAVGNYSKAFGGTANGDYSLTSGSSVTTTVAAIYSIAMGFEVEASGKNSVAIGSGEQIGTDVFVEAKGEGSISLGSSTKANAKKSIAIGSFTVANGENSVSLGTVSTADGVASMALGNFVTAGSAWSTAIGYNNLSWGDAVNQVDTDPLFLIGNGFSGPEHNAVSVLKNGNVGIATNTPSQKLDINGNMYISGSIIMGTTYNVAPLNVEKWQGPAAMFNRRNTDGTIISLYHGDSYTEVGTISVTGTTVSYNAFTGSHYGITNEQIDEGTLVVMNGSNSWLGDNEGSEVLYGISESSQANDPAAMGAYLGILESMKPYSNSNPYLIMAEGNGEMWVVDNGDNLQPGDFLISSSVKGHAMKDKGEFAESYVIAKVAEPVNWQSVSETVDGIKHQKVSVLFTSFVRNNNIANQTEEVEELKERIKQLETLVQQMIEEK